MLSALNQAQILQVSILKNIEEGQAALKQDTVEILTLLQKPKSSIIHAPNSFTDFKSNAFSYLEPDFYRQAIRHIKDVTPENIFDEYVEKLFYPHESNRNAVIEQLSKETLNKKLWSGWLELLVLIHLKNNQKPEINNLEIKLDDSASTIIKLYFTQNKKYSDFIHELLEDELVEDGTCFIFNSEEPLRPHVYPEDKIYNIIKDISSVSSFDDLNPLENKRFGIMHFEKIRDTLAECDDKSEMDKKIKRLIDNVVK